MKIESQTDVERVMAERGISFVFRPLITEQRGGSCVARYPGADWSVTGRDADEVRRRLRDEELARIGDPNTADWKINAVRLHLSEGPVEGVYELSNKTADRVIDAATHAALDAEIASIDRASRTPHTERFPG